MTITEAVKRQRVEAAKDRAVSALKAIIAAREKQYQAYLAGCQEAHGEATELLDKLIDEAEAMLKERW